MADDISADERRAAHRRGHSTPMLVRGREDAQRADTLVCATGALKAVGTLVDGQMLVVAGDQIASQEVPTGSGEHTHVVADITDLDLGDYALANHDHGLVGASFTQVMLETPVPLTAAPASVFTIAIPAAGTYLLDGTFLVQSGTLAANRVVTFYFGHAALVGCKIGWAQGASVSTANGFGYGSDFSNALPALAFASTQDNVYSSVRCWGEFTVGASGNLTVVAEIPADTATALAGSTLRLIRAS